MKFRHFSIRYLFSDETINCNDFSIYLNTQYKMNQIKIVQLSSVQKIYSSCIHRWWAAAATK